MTSTGQTHNHLVHTHTHARTHIRIHMLVSRAFQRCLDCCCHWSNGSHMSVALSFEQHTGQCGLFLRLHNAFCLGPINTQMEQTFTHRKGKTKRDGDRYRDSNRLINRGRSVCVCLCLSTASVLNWNRRVPPPPSGKAKPLQANCQSNGQHSAKLW